MRSPGRRGRRPRRSTNRRLGFQARVIIAFAVGTALVSAVLAASTFFFVRRELVAQRTTSVLRQTFVNARLVKIELGAPTADIGDVLSSLTPANGATAFIYRHGLWYSTSATTRGTAVPAALTAAVLGGHVAEQRVYVAGVPTAVVGVPVPAIGVAYFEEHPLGDLAATLGVLSTVLVTVAITTTIGGALCGWWASRLLVRPLGEVVSAASEIAGGSLDRRLPDDPDLRPLVSSFNDMVDALQARIERDARFASDVTHELRSPVTAIGASVELLGSYRSALPGEAVFALDTLHLEVDRFAAMVEELLDMASIDAGSASAHFTDNPVGELVRRTVAGYDPSIRVDIAPGASDALVHGDKRRLRQVLLNLLDNAETHAGGAVRVGVRLEDPWVAIVVDDAGPGIPPEERTRVFERFYRGAASGRRGEIGGVGLGLALVREHVVQHGGSVQIGESPEGGARVEVLLRALDVVGDGA